MTSLTKYETETIKHCIEQAIEPQEQIRGDDILL